jgi:hypothetical protein
VVGRGEYLFGKEETIAQHHIKNLSVSAALLCGHHHRSPFQGKKSANRPDASGAGKKEKKREQNQSREVTMVRWIYYLCDIIIQRQRTK